MLKKSLAAVLTCFMTLGVAQIASAEGVVQSASKDAAKGMIKGVQQELNTGTMIEGVKQVTKGMIDGAANAVPTVASQLVNQTNVNRKTIGNVARTVTREAVSGAMTGSVNEMQDALGKNGEGALATTLAASSEKITAATIRGIKSEIRLDPETTQQLTAAAVRGAMSEIHFNIPVWSYLLAFVLGCFSTMLCGVGLMVLYMLFQRRRAPAVEPVQAVAPSPIAKTRPVYTVG